MLLNFILVVLHSTKTHFLRYHPKQFSSLCSPGHAPYTCDSGETDHLTSVVYIDKSLKARVTLL